jgi:uncharacterized protein with HEPN domain
MLDAARYARLFVAGRNRPDLDSDAMLTFALTRATEIIGEAAINISKDTRNQLPQFEWDKIINMRHKLVHAYFQVDLDILWDTVKRDIPKLIEELENIPELS